MSQDDHTVLISLREAIARMETRQAYILELLTDHKAKMDRIEQEAQGIKELGGYPRSSNAMNRDDQAIKVMQYLWDEGFLRLYLKNGQPMVALTTEVSEVHEAIRVRFKKKADPADWWKNETKK